MAYRLLHFSDLHLDASFAADGVSSAVGDWRRSDLRAALARILALARDQRVDAVTIAGDLYDERTAMPDTGDFLAQQFARLGNIPVVIAPGHSDPYTARSLYALTRWPSNVHIFANELTAVRLAPDIDLWGASQEGAMAMAPALGAFQSGIHLLLRHGSDKRSKGFEQDLGAVRRQGFTLVLSGGSHAAGEWPEDAPLWVWGGSPEPLAWEDGEGDRGLVTVTIEDSRTSWQRLRVAQWRYWRTDVDVSDCADGDEAVRKIKNVLTVAPGGADERLMCRMTLVGTPPVALDLSTLHPRLETPAHVSIVSRLSSSLNLDRLSEEQTVRGLLARRFQDRLANIQDPQQRQLTLKALGLALDALAGRQVRDHETA